jgi:hypothetical protein
MSKIYVFTLFIGLIALFTTSCDTTPAPEVAYLQIDTLQVNANGTQGTSSSELTTFWVEQNGQQIGAFTPPSLVPVLAGENQSIRIIPGININGSFSQRNQYEILSPRTFNFTLNQGDTRTLSPAATTFSYNTNYTIEVIEDFDAVGLNYLRSDKSDTNLLITSDPSEVFIHPGETPNKSGKIVMRPFSRAEFKTLQSFELPQFAANVWMEINYKSDIPLTFGVVANEQLQSIQAPVVTLFANEEWNKVYINLVTEVSGYPNAVDYNLFFGAINTTKDTATIFVDNIKLLY